jgi:predicted nucleotide-binding protein
MVAQAPEVGRQKCLMRRAALFGLAPCGGISSPKPLIGFPTGRTFSMARIEPNKVQELLTANNIGFVAHDIPHGRQFRFDDGAILNVYSSGKCVWQGKETPSCIRVKPLLEDGAQPSPPQEKAQGLSSPSTNKIFIVYGHDVEAREQLELLLRRMKLEPVILQNLPIGGQTIIEKLESNLDVRYACVLLTPDDEGFPAGSPKDRKPRARQNVVLELGMFLVRLGRKRVAILYKGNLELPSDINGLIYIKFNRRIDEVKERLGAELQEAGFPINIKDLLS